MRGFYAALGVQLPGWAQREAPVRCFADPDAHAHEDRHPSCSVNVHSGAFNCHGCGAHGGVYDAALAIGHSPRSAIDLMITHGLTDRRAPLDTSRGAPTRTTPEAAGATARGAPAPATTAQPGTPAPAVDESGWRTRRAFFVSPEYLRRCARALHDDARLLTRVCGERGWKPNALRELGVGFDGDRITVPITDQGGALQWLLRLRVDESWQTPKVRTAYGTRLGLIPHPKLVEGPVVLVEGPSDALAARSAGLPAIAVAGTQAWRAEWASMFSGREVTVVMDADHAGRQAAARIARDLQAHGARAAIVDLDPSRDDGYDLSDWLRAGNKPTALPNALALASNDTSGRSVADRHDHRPQAGSEAAPAASRADATTPRAAIGPSTSRARSTRCAAF